MSGTQLVTGSFVGTGAALDVETVGFKPRYVRMWNVSDPGTLEWTDGMADAAGFKHVDGTQTQLSANGVTPIAKGFTLGADADMNVSGEVIHFVAHR